MKSYPSIGKQYNNNQLYYIFDKLDGSNMRAEWCPKRGFYRFGSRRNLIDNDTPILGESISLFMEKYSKELSYRYKDLKYKSVITFFEFFGENSFAGQHSEEDDKQTKLIDIAPFKKGILPPEKFLDVTEGLDIANFLGIRKIDDELLLDVKSGNLLGMSFEGIIAKAMTEKGLHMVKLKNQDWIRKLAIKYGDNSQLFNQLK